MKQLTNWKKMPLLLIASFILITIAFAQSNSGKAQHSTTDTVPAKQKKIYNLDEALAEVDREEMEMERALSGIEKEKMEKEIRKAMKNMEVDMAKMKEDIAKAMKELDEEKIQMEVQKELAKIDGKKMKAEVTAALSAAEKKKIKAELAESQKLDLQKMKEELANIKPQIEKAMKEAKESMEEVRKELKAYKNLVDALEKDGLLNKNENYTIEYKNRSLTVNGIQLPSETTRKHQKFLYGKKEFTIKKDADGLNINK